MKKSINEILVYVLCGLGALILFCTLTAFLAGKASFNTYRRGDPETVKNNSKDNTQNEFKEFGTLRALTKPEKEEFSNGANLVVTPWFVYSNADSAFYEELVQKKKSISTIILGYFASRTQKELFSYGEKKVKEDIKNLINEQLVLGKIEAVYFDDYIFLD
ncbi:MAG: flagellar basal body-associated FliL family protein [Treponema sp.]|uniref:flagellar basal body-associated FliL family protein n=1 Tax=Treponema sp. TaxID=166 RepID=UPI001B4B32D1|nr:flagellar basal body-associated FliL family protein [Treponema sp.]MBP5588466.1 flagellar basal body-associated FliL family protein [Treponema sp.]MBR0155209.1 flagellar basal body-associated FliL family protein [Treponema sp.]